MKPKAKAKPGLTATEFDALPDTEKQRIYDEIDGMSDAEIRAKYRPLSTAEKADWRRIQSGLRRGRGRPKLGKNGAERVSISIEETLLARIDAYVKKHGKSRSEVFVNAAIHYIGR